MSEEVKYQLIRSFGPSVFKIQIPKTIIDKLNKNSVSLSLCPDFGIILSQIFNMDIEYYLIKDNKTEIANEIEEKVQYPGEIKVNVIRELRAESYAR